MTDTTTDTTIRFEDVSVFFRHRSGTLIVGLDGLNSTIPPGQFVSIVGRSGHGKSTLLRALAGQLDDDAVVRVARCLARVRANLTSSGFIKHHAAADFARAVVERFGVKTPSVEAAAKSLSGGNLQKFVVGREILRNPGVLIVNQPTWGVDAADVEARLAQMSQAELASLAERLDATPAGAGAVEVIGVVFLVLLILELVGVIDIFKAI